MWFTCRMPANGIEGQSNNAGSDTDKGVKDYLWTIGVVAGVAIGAVSATVVVLKFTKQRAKKVGTSDTDFQKTGKAGLPEKGHHVY